MNKTSLLIYCLALVPMLFTSCSNEDEKVDWNGVEVKNIKLKEILHQKGFTFNEKGRLVLNEKATNTTMLDLSGTKITDLSGLDILPNLMEVNLSNNDYGPIFDFSTLPKKISSVDLTGNKVYDFEGLVSTEFINDEMKTTVLHPLTKLYLPATAKFNVEDLVPFHKTSTSTDIQMQDAMGKLQTYNTLREIPDEALRIYLKSKFISLFPDNGDLFDIAKRMALKEEGESISLPWRSENGAIKSIEGIEYFINNPFYKPFFVAIDCSALSNVSYLAPRNNIKALSLRNINMPNGIDLSKASKLCNLALDNNDHLTTLDLSNTLIANQKFEDIDNTTIGNSLDITRCKNLEEIKFPFPNVGIVSGLTIGGVPKLKKIDLSFIKATQELALLQMSNCAITYPDLKYRYDVATGTLTKLEEVPDGSGIGFAISKDVFDMPATKEFFTKFRSKLSDRYRGYDKDTDYSYNLGGYRWSKYL
ncbi:MAG: hypothetical protein RR711_05395 [Bacteroides sp.]